MMGLWKFFDLAENLLDVTFAMTVHSIRLLDIDISSVTVTKTYILLLAFCTSLQHVYWIIYLLFIYTLFIVDKQT